MIFVDSSAIHAVLDQDDQNHAQAAACWRALLQQHAILFTTNYVVVESCALAQSRLGLQAVRTIQDDLMPSLDVLWIDESVHRQAMAALLAARRRKLSLVDCSSFLVIRQAGARFAFAFDKHFTEEGFLFPQV